MNSRIVFVIDLVYDVLNVDTRRDGQNTVALRFKPFTGFILYESLASRLAILKLNTVQSSKCTYIIPFTRLRRSISRVRPVGRSCRKNGTDVSSFEHRVTWTHKKCPSTVKVSANCPITSHVVFIYIIINKIILYYLRAATGNNWLPKRSYNYVPERRSRTTAVYNIFLRLVRKTPDRTRSFAINGLFFLINLHYIHRPTYKTMPEKLVRAMSTHVSKSVYIH